MKLLLLYAFVQWSTFLSLCASVISQGRLYEKGEELKLFVHELWSPKVPVSLKYYDLPFCPFKGGSTPVEHHGGIGNLLEGRMAQETSYELKLLQDENIKVLCERHGDLSLNSAQVLLLSHAIERSYEVHMSVDSLPAVSTKKYVEETENGHREPRETYSKGYLLGNMSDNDVKINNHLSIEVKYHIPGKDAEKYNIVEFVVTPRSIDHEDLAKNGLWDRKNPDSSILSKKNGEIIFAPPPPPPPPPLLPFFFFFFFIHNSRGSGGVGAQPTEPFMSLFCF